jgi:hypothetical protein
MRLAAILLALTASASATTVSTPAPPETRTVDGKHFVLVGRGATPEYELAIFVDETEARRHFPALAMRAGGRSRAALIGGDHAQTFLIWGRFGKLVELKAKKALTPAQLREMFAGVSDEIGEKASADLRSASDGFLAMIAGLDQLDDGEMLTIYGDGDGKLVVTEADGPSQKTAPSAKLVRAVFSVWLGQKPLSPELRRALVDKVDLLGK